MRSVVVAMPARLLLARVVTTRLAIIGMHSLRSLFLFSTRNRSFFQTLIHINDIKAALLVLLAIKLQCSICIPHT